MDECSTNFCDESDDDSHSVTQSYSSDADENVDESVSEGEENSECSSDDDESVSEGDENSQSSSDVEENDDESISEGEEYSECNSDRVTTPYDEGVPPVRRKLFNDPPLWVNTPEIDCGMARDMNGVENMDIDHSGVNNVIDKERRLKFRDGDAHALQQLLTKLASDGQDLFHTCRFDESGVLKDLIWVDARCRAAYKEFGDVVFIDSTCFTSNYELPLVNFVGVNHHGQSTLFGCALLSRDDADTFQWLFDAWLQCMNEKAPAGILTDQSAEMRKALTVVMPNTQHRWYLGYILQKFYKKLKLHERYFDLKEAIFSAIYGSFTPEEFEQSWSDAMKKFRLEGNHFLKDLYRERKMWVPAYSNQLFWAGMVSTQQVQTVKSFFAGYLGKHTRLYEFAPQYCIAMESKALEEERADAWASLRRMLPATGYQVEQIFEKLYTKAMFLKVQSECLKLWSVGNVPTKNPPNELVEHVLEDRVWTLCPTSKKEIATDHRRIVKVTFDNSCNEAYCQCKLFEREGILCSHIIRVYDMRRATKVPGKFILKRWRKDILRKHTMVKVAYHTPYRSPQVKRYETLIAAFEPIRQMASKSEKLTAFVLKALQELKEKIEMEIDDDDYNDGNHASGNCHT